MALGQLHNFFDVSATDGDATLEVNNNGSARTGILTIQVTGTVSVDYSVRNPQDDAWIIVGTYTADTVVEVPLGKKIRVDTGSTVGGGEAVRADIWI